MKLIKTIPYLVDQQASAELQIFVTSHYYQGILINDTANSSAGIHGHGLKLSRPQAVALIDALTTALQNSDLITPGLINTQHPGYVLQEK